MKEIEIQTRFQHCSVLKGAKQDTLTQFFVQYISSANFVLETEQLHVVLYRLNGPTESRVASWFPHAFNACLFMYIYMHILFIAYTHAYASPYYVILSYFRLFGTIRMEVLLDYRELLNAGFLYTTRSVYFITTSSMNYSVTESIEYTRDQ